MCCEEGKGKSICQSLSLGDFLRAWEKLRGNKQRTAPLKVLGWVGGGAEWYLDFKTKEDDPRVQDALSFDGKAHERYSTFIFQEIGAFAYECSIGTSNMVFTHNHFCSPVEIDFLRESYQAGPHDESGQGLYLFFSNRGMVRIDCFGDPRSKRVKAMWTIRAKSEKSLMEMLKPLWTLRGLGKSLESTTLDPFHPGKLIKYKGGTAVLNRLRKEFGTP